ncbi:hypothetical protein H0H92_011819 [Tricholoma furcatifolium]|nr:hypothetical protein H0H92_011819 [Tricholoma furcatifolium]
MAFDEPHDEKTSKIDWQGLRQRSLQPGGFGPSRLQIWPEILGVQIPAQKKEEDTCAEAGGDGGHRDEHQIRLDTDRSFVLYPGYHDIVSVLFLTLPDELQFACAEKISLHRVRDSMGSTLEPVLGLLRVTKNLLRLADLEYAQHLERREAVLRQFENGDEDDNMGISHSLLSSMPPMTDEDLTNDSRLDDGEKPFLKDTKDGETGLQEKTAGFTQGEDSKTEAEAEEAIAPVVELATEQTFLPTPPDPRHDTPADDSVEPMAPLNSAFLPSTEEKSPLLPPEKLPFIPPDNEEAETRPAIPNTIPTPPLSRPSSPPCYPSEKSEISLSSLLNRADELYALYPPAHPGLSLSRIMGPQSVIYTWSESHSALPTDAEAESMVLQPGLIVYPYIDEDDVIEEEEDSSDELDEKTPSTPTAPKRKRFRPKKLRGKVKDKLKRLGVRRMKVDQTTGMVAGAVIVLGIAMAVYGVSMRENQQGLGRGVLDVHDQDWKKVATWFGAVVAGVTEKVAGGLSTSTPPHGQG